MNTRLDEIQAAILRVKLPHLNRFNEARRQVAALYDEGLAQLSSADLFMPAVPHNSGHVFHQYVIKTRNRNALKQFFAERGIITLIHYPVPIHRQPAYSQRKLTGDCRLTITDWTADEILSLPIHPYLTRAEIKRVIDALFEADAAGII